MRSRQASEDWVIQTRDLRIVGDGNSPQPEQQRAFTPILEGPEPHGCGTENSQMDGDMVRNPYCGVDGSDNYDHPYLPHLVCSLDVQSMDSDEPMNSLALAAPPNSPAQPPLSTPPSSSSSTQFGPSQLSQQNQYLLPTFLPPNPDNSHPATPFSPPTQEVQEPQDINMHSPRISPAPISTRRQRFTMGPRADCEKCRMGVKGHWVHFD